MAPPNGPVDWDRRRNDAKWRAEVDQWRASTDAILREMRGELKAIHDNQLTRDGKIAGRNELFIQTRNALLFLVAVGGAGTLVWNVFSAAVRSAGGG